VNWLPWGEAALSAAKTFDKPILLSIDYSACHWCCHVMARESFEHPETAALMNQSWGADRRLMCARDRPARCQSPTPVNWRSG
jgi:hypothetical protein